MSQKIEIFVNEKRVLVESGNSVRKVLRDFDPALAAGVESGSAYVTDGVGRTIDAADEVIRGSILRVTGRIDR